MRSLAAAVLLLLAGRVPAAERLRADCRLKVGENDLTRAHGDVVVERGKSLESVVALHGNVLLQPGARVKEAVAVGGTVTVDGATVRESAVSVGGDVVIRGGGKVGKDAVSVGGKVRAEKGSVAGSTLGLAIEVNGRGLASAILKELAAEGVCTVVEEE